MPEKTIWIVLLAIAGWFVFGDPPKTIANLFWNDNAAPWEQVDAFYYPDKEDPSVQRERFAFESVEECRRWVAVTASEHNDPSLEQGSFECGIGPTRTGPTGDLKTYRTTVR